MRLDRFLANNSHYSRSEIKRMAREDRIRVNNEAPKHISMDIDEAVDRVCIDGEHIERTGMLYIMLNKPVGAVCATEDGLHATVLQTLTDQAHFIGSEKNFKRIHRATLQIVGRLDKDTSGLLFLTNDGNWNHRLCSPRYRCTKTYQVTLTEPVSEQTQSDFRQGIQLRGEPKITRPAQLEILAPCEARVHIEEGKYHQVKRMFAACGNHVLTLHREKIGHVTLDHHLQPGQFRMLTESELEVLH